MSVRYSYLECLACTIGNKKHRITDTHLKAKLSSHQNRKRSLLLNENFIKLTQIACDFLMSHSNSSPFLFYFLGKGKYSIYTSGSFTFPTSVACKQIISLFCHARALSEAATMYNAPVSYSFIRAAALTHHQD